MNINHDLTCHRCWLFSLWLVWPVTCVMGYSPLARAGMVVSEQIGVEASELATTRVPFAANCGAAQQSSAAFYFTRLTPALTGSATAGSGTVPQQQGTEPLRHGDTPALQLTVSSRGLEWSAALAEQRQIWLSAGMQMAHHARPLPYLALAGAEPQLFWQEPDGQIRAAKLSGGQIRPQWQAGPFVPTSAGAEPLWQGGELALVRTAGRASQLVLAGPPGSALLLLDVTNGARTLLPAPPDAGTTLGQPTVLDTNQDGNTDQIYLVSAQQQIWRWQRIAGSWQAELVAQLPAELGDLTGGLQVWPARWPVSRPVTPVAALSDLTHRPPATHSAPVPAAATETAPAILRARQQGHVLVLLTRHEHRFGVLVLKVGQNQHPPARLSADNPMTEQFWFYPLPGRPVQPPLILGSVLYLPLTDQQHCEYPQSYQQLLALDLFNGQPVYADAVLQFSQRQQQPLLLNKQQQWFSLGTADEQIISQLRVLDPACDYCHRLLSPDMLQQQRWVAGYLAERAY